MWQGEGSAETVRKKAGEFAQTLARARPEDPGQVAVKHGSSFQEKLKLRGCLVQLDQQK